MRVDAEDFLTFAADVFGVRRAVLSLETTYGSVPEWDSMAQLRLVTEVAARYGVEIPFADVVTVTSLYEVLRRINGDPVRKAVAVDLDGTLWKGVVGEDGADALVPDRDLQSRLKALRDRGVILVALSKNEARDALDALSRQPVLGRDDFVAVRFDWKPKAENLLEIAGELNLGPDAFVFVDDNPAERLEMSVRLPEVAVAGFPPRVEAYFPERPLTEEDRRKTDEYRAEAKRRECLKGLPDARIWEALGIELDVHPLRDGEVPRVAQLAQKANQFNVLTRRRTEGEVRAMGKSGLLATAHARDRFGDQGLVAFVAVAGGEITDWVMSCRVMGRGLERRIEAEVERLLAARGVRELTATWRDSGRNRPVRDLFDRFGFGLLSETSGERRYRRSLVPSPPRTGEAQ